MQNTTYFFQFAFCHLEFIIVNAEVIWSWGGVGQIQLPTSKPPVHHTPSFWKHAESDIGSSLIIYIFFI